MLQVRAGVDLVAIKDFAGAVQRGGAAFRRRVFHPSEAAGGSVARLAACKALELPAGDRLVVALVNHASDG